MRARLDELVAKCKSATEYSNLPPVSSHLSRTSALLQLDKTSHSQHDALR